LSGADLSGADYNESTGFFALQCPEKGSFIGYKKAQGFIVELLILDDARRSSATSRKCRCDKAKVLSITNKDGSESKQQVESDYGGDFVYTVGEIVEERSFCGDRWQECAEGIHFFITRDEAVKYN
ncbi:MAG: DUF5758 domain-containing protein, partial [Lachnospiraceae bacterium]